MGDQNESKVAARDWLITKYKEQETKLTGALGKLERTLPKGMNAKQFLQIVLNSFTKNPKLLECTPGSVVGCVLTAAQLGLKPDGITGEAYMIPFRNNKRGVMEAQLIPGYKGLVQLAYRSGQVKRFQGRAVMEGDAFDWAMGTTEYIRHKPADGDKATGVPTHFYAILEFANGGLTFEVMTYDQVIRVRDESKNWKAAVKYHRESESTWSKYFTEMGIKTAIRRLSKYAPVSAEFQRALALEEQLEILGKNQNMEQVTVDEDMTAKEKIEVTGNTITDNYEDLEFEDVEDEEEETKFKKKGNAATKETEKLIKK